MFRTLLLAGALAAAPLAAQAQDIRPQIDERRSGQVTEINVAGPGSWGEVSGQLRALLADPNRAKGVPAPTAEERDTLPPPLLLERAWRLTPLDAAEAERLITLATVRMRWDAAQCQDPTAGQGVIIVMMMFQEAGAGREPEKARKPAEALKRILDSGEGFSSKASPWWICSHGMQAMVAGVEGGTLKEADWRLPAKEREAARKDLEQRLRQAQAQMAAAPGG